MTVARRTLALHTLAVGVACAIPSGVGLGRAEAAARTGQAAAGPLPGPSRAEWKRLVGSELHVVHRPGLLLIVDGVEDSSAVTRKNRVPDRGEVFTIRFAQRSGPALREGIHSLHLPVRGHSPLFLSPTGRKARYRAVVNMWLPLNGSGKALNGVGAVSR
ncbi:hypothetical protein [Streptomyces sp. NPDC052036]|uniref:DUF6916 family protein n=1 Tax=Streptomyces sp. NPDC052036 TaxID=3155171 RepID=UPI00344A2F64